MRDVIIVGGSYAGMAAALQLLRARRSVMVVDAGLRRNRFASRSHGFLGWDGVDPGRIAAEARAQLAAYPTLDWVEDSVITAVGRKDAFRVLLGDGSMHEARRLVLATGVRDELPALPGLAERWGRSVLQCPYCHGYELNRGRIGVIATAPSSVSQAVLLKEWGRVTLLANGAMTADAATRQGLASRQIGLEEVPLAAIEGEAVAVLADGRRLEFDAIFTALRFGPASALATEMGCQTREVPMGVLVTVSDSRETSVPGVFACGDVMRLPHLVSVAVSEGAVTGGNVHRSLVFPGM